MGLKRRLWSLLESRGYHLHNDEYMPYGIKAFSDIRRLAQGRGWPIEAVFDVGANTGSTAAEALRRFPGARIVCFEPHPLTFNKLATAYASEPRVVAHNTALGHSVGKAPLFQYESSLLNSLIRTPPLPCVSAPAARPSPCR